LQGDCSDAFVFIQLRTGFFKIIRYPRPFRDQHGIGFRGHMGSVENLEGNPNQVLLLLDALRKVLIQSGIVIFLLSIVGYFFSLRILAFLQIRTGVTLPYGVRFLLSFKTSNLEPVISVKKFVSFCFLFVFGFGCIFEIPLVMILLARLGLVQAGMLAGQRRYAILSISIISAVLTPTPDIFNMALMGVPLYLLYEIGLIGMRIWGKHEL
jgi:Sec-independent protein secretion pathway component TatC